MNSKCKVNTDLCLLCRRLLISLAITQNFLETEGYGRLLIREQIYTQSSAVSDLAEIKLYCSKIVAYLCWWIRCQIFIWRKTV